MKKQLSEAEKAQTPLSEELAAHPQTPKSLATVIEAIMLYHKLDRRSAVCALRDYFQVEVAKCIDEQVAETQERIRELEGRLHKDHA